MTHTSPNFLHALATLRWVAVGGQALAIAVAAWLLRLPLPWPALLAGVAALAAFNLWALRRSRRVLVSSPGELFAHLVVDVAVLAWLVTLSGGATNPFTSLFLLPIALVALFLPPAWVGAVAALCGVAYALCAIFGRPLPHVHGAFGDSFDLHLAGMAVNFVISALVVTVLLTHIAQALRRREQELARLREQFARNEGIVALATHAASVAHELNTPLGAMTLMVEDWLDPQAPPPARDELRTLSTLVDACRDRVRALAAPARNAAATVRDVRAELDDVVARWQLLRPTVQVRRSGSVGGCAALDPGIGHLLQALLNNAADAGERAGDPRVDLRLSTAGDALEGEVRDYGAGFERGAPLPASLFRTTKADGLGVGLALSHATVERLGGELAMEAAPDGGVRVRFRLPLAGAACTD